MKIIEGRIFPGQGIGEFMLGSDEDAVLANIEGEYKRSERENGISLIIIENAIFWFDSNKQLFQIGVTVGFLSKYDNIIGIGDTLADVQEKVGPFYEEYDDYLIQGVKGIAFELGDTDDLEWDEMRAPIEWMYVYKEFEYHN